MRFAKTLANAYGISLDMAILIAATGHRQELIEDDVRDCKYSHDLPKGIAEFVVISTARRAIRDGEDLQEIFDRISSLEISPTEQHISNFNEMLNTHDTKLPPKQLKNYYWRDGNLGFKILKHAAIYQKEILKEEYNGILPRKLPQMIVQEVNQLRHKLGK